MCLMCALQIVCPRHARVTAGPPKLSRPRRPRSDIGQGPILTWAIVSTHRTCAVTAKRKRVTNRKQGATDDTFSALRNRWELLLHSYQTHDLFPADLCLSTKDRESASDHPPQLLPSGRAWPVPCELKTKRLAFWFLEELVVPSFGFCTLWESQVAHEPDSDATVHTRPCRQRRRFASLRTGIPGGVLNVRLTSIRELARDGRIWIQGKTGRRRLDQLQRPRGIPDTRLTQTTPPSRYSAVCQTAMDRNQPLFLPSKKDGSHRALSFAMVPSCDKQQGLIM